MLDFLFTILGLLYLLYQWLDAILTHVPGYAWFFIFALLILIKLGSMLESLQSGMSEIVKRLDKIEERLSELPDEISQQNYDPEDDEPFPP